MRLPLVLLIQLLGEACGFLQPQVNSATNTQAPAMATTPRVHHCWSPNMVYFTCWWHPAGNVSDGEDVGYRLDYNIENGPVSECPDYVTGGPNSCHFDSSHTSIWMVYCMTVTATAASWNATSRPFCVDVADIVQTEAPVNMSYSLRAAGGDELGHSALLSWSYPVPGDLQYGWITLVYELQYRRLTEPDNWKVKSPQRESQLELMGLPVGRYLARVRCRSHNSGLWSKWSSTLQMTIPAQPLAGKMLVLILVVGIAVATLLIICFGVIPQGKRIKAHLFPPIPKPRIGGIDPLLLKKGKLDEIDHHFRTFHSYSHPIPGEEVWNYVSAEDGFTAAPPSCALWPERHDKPAPPAGEGAEPATLHAPPTTTTITATAVTAPHLTSTEAPGTDATTYCGLLPPKCPEAAYTQPAGAGQWEWPTPAPDYSLLATQPSSPQPPEVVPIPPPADFYTCAQLLGTSGEVNLVPCLTPQPQTPNCQGVEDLKRRPLADHLGDASESSGPN